MEHSSCTGRCPSTRSAPPSRAQGSRTGRGAGDNTKSGQVALFDAKRCHSLAGVRMDAPQHGESVLSGRCLEAVYDRPEPLVVVDRLPPVERGKEVLMSSDSEPLMHVAALGLRLEVPQHLVDGVPRHVDLVPPECLRAAGSVGCAPCRASGRRSMVDDPAVDLFGHAVVVAAVSRFHVIDGNAQAFGHDRGQAAVGVAQHKEAVWPSERMTRSAPPGWCRSARRSCPGAEFVVRRATPSSSKNTALRLSRSSGRCITTMWSQSASSLRMTRQRRMISGRVPSIVMIFMATCPATVRIGGQLRDISGTDGGAAYPAAVQREASTAGRSVRSVRSTGDGADTRSIVMSVRPYARAISASRPAFVYVCRRDDVLEVRRYVCSAFRPAQRRAKARVVTPFHRWSTYPLTVAFAGCRRSHSRRKAWVFGSGPMIEQRRRWTFGSLASPRLFVLP